MPDATVDPFHLALANVDHARLLNGSVYRAHTELLRFEIVDGEIRSAVCRDNRTGASLVVRARQVVNAGGAWAMKIARLAGCADVDLLYVKGTLLVNHDRMTHHVVNRLRPPGDGDILVPGRDGLPARNDVDARRRPGQRRADDRGESTATSARARR